MIRCVAYYGSLKGDLPQDEIERIARRVEVRNAGLGVTGCLFHFGGHFVQVLEGGYDEVGRLYGTIVSDERPADLISLSDHIVQARAYSTWSIRFIPGGAAAAAKSLDALPPLRPVGRALASDDPDAANRARMVAALAEKLERRISTCLRTIPRQPRAMKTVDRLVEAAAAMTTREGSLARLTLETAAAEAGVTQQSAYRYFADIGDLLRASVRRTQAGWYARFLDFMARQTFGSALDVADAAVVFVAETYLSQIAASPRMQLEMLSLYHDIEYDAAWLVSDALCESIGRLNSRSVRIGNQEMAAALTALWAVAKLFALRDPASLWRPPARQLMIRMAHAALSPPPGGDADSLALV